jgi:peroxiredoxin
MTMKMKMRMRMGMEAWRRLLAVVLVSGMLVAPGTVQGQMPVIVGQQMPDFTLSAIQGGSVTLSDLTGKNVLLIFPRGRVGDHWCQICHYQYAELVELEKKLNLRDKYNLEILFVLPYGEEAVKEWVEIFPHQMEVIEGWKNPPDDENLSERRRAWAETAREVFPMTFTYEDGDIPVPFPILVDGDREVSQRLRLFTTNWDRSEVEQNIPTIFILDGDGVVQFKYHSQTTFDRPAYDYLFNVIDKLIISD